MPARTPLRCSVLRRSIAGLGALSLVTVTAGCAAGSATSPRATPPAASSPATATLAVAPASTSAGQNSASAALQGVAAGIDHTYRLTVSAYDLMCRWVYGLTCRSRGALIMASAAPAG